jgi:hypothetical protein
LGCEIGAKKGGGKGGGVKVCSAQHNKQMLSHRTRNTVFKQLFFVRLVALLPPRVVAELLLDVLQPCLGVDEGAFSCGEKEKKLLKFKSKKVTRINKGAWRIITTQN